MQEAPTLACPRCGAVLPVDSSAREASCAHCGNTTAVPEALRAAAQAHLARIDPLAEAEARAQRELAYARGTWVEPRASTAAATLVACSACGGPVPYAAGATSAKCPHCGATTLETGWISARQAEQAVAAADAAVEASVRANRARGRAVYANQSMMRVLFLALASLGPAGGILGLGFGAVMVGLYGESDDLAVALGLGAGAVVSALAVVVVLFLALGRAPDEAKIDRALSRAATLLQAKLERGGIEPALAFVDRFWLDESPSDLTYRRGRFAREQRWALTGSYRGCPSLITVVAGRGAPGPWMGWFLVADLPYTADPEALLRSEPAERARALGAEPHVTRTGVYFSRSRFDASHLEANTAVALFESAARMVELGRQRRS